MTVADLGEHALLARVLARLPRVSTSVLVGPGDDAAVVATTRNDRLVVTTDAIVDGVHVSRTSSSPADIGHKALAVNLSDLAAMGATPRWALLSLILPGDWPVAEVEGLVDGFAALARQHGVNVIGGNITRTAGPLVVDVTAGGDVRPRRWLARGGARPGDEIFLSGSIGAAAAGLEMLQGSLSAAGPCVDRQLRPVPRVRLGAAMGRARAATAAMDLSDGLADAVRQVCDASGCGARLDAGALPIEPAARDWWTSRSVDPVIAAVAGGEDYELVFAVPRKRRGRVRGVRRHVTEPALTKIGEFTREAGVCVIDRDGVLEPLPTGFEHFRGGTTRAHGG